MWHRMIYFNESLIPSVIKLLILTKIDIYLQYFVDLIMQECSLNKINDLFHNTQSSAKNLTLNK